MTINGKIGEFSRNEERARGAGHDPVVVAKALVASQGILPVGLLLTETASGCVPLAVVEDEAYATGDGTETTFAATLAETPVEPGSVSLGTAVETFIDDGHGQLFGSAGGTGTIRYATGGCSVTFAAAPANAAAITADYMTQISAVLDEAVDTTYSGSGLCVIHGSVQADVLKVQDGADFVAVDAAMMKRLSGKGIYPA